VAPQPGLVCRQRLCRPSGRDELSFSIEVVEWCWDHGMGPSAGRQPKARFYAYRKDLKCQLVRPLDPVRVATRRQPAGQMDERECGAGANREVDTG